VNTTPNKETIMESDVRAKLDAAWKLRCTSINETAGSLAVVIEHANDSGKLHRVRCIIDARMAILKAEAGWIDALIECCGDIDVDCERVGGDMKYILETGEVFESRMQPGPDDLDEDERVEAKTTVPN
jgi:hypothetical protein